VRKGKLGGVTDDEEARGALSGGKGVRGQGEAWELGSVRRGVRRCPGGAYIGSGEEGKGLPAAMAINGHATLMGIQEGG
jgi:hypothetical protein